MARSLSPYAWTVAAGETNRAVIARVLETAIVPDFVAKKNVKIQVNENENVQEQTSMEDKV